MKTCMKVPKRQDNTKYSTNFKRILYPFYINYQIIGGIHSSIHLGRYIKLFEGPYKIRLLKSPNIIPITLNF